MTADDWLHCVTAWHERRPIATESLRGAAARLVAWHAEASEFISAMDGAEPGSGAARTAFRSALRAAHAPILAHHHAELAELLRDVPPRAIDPLLGARAPGLVPTPEQSASERKRPLGRKLGYELQTALVYAELLSAHDSGLALLDVARRPSDEALTLRSTLRDDDQVDLGAARVRIIGPAAWIEITRPEVSNAEDDDLLSALETCVDLALLDSRAEVVTVRGGPIRKGPRAGKRVFCSGIDLTALAGGSLSYGYFVRREIGVLDKIFRGLAESPASSEIEKPFVAIVDGHAIGGGLQMLLVMDHVIAEEGAWMSLPARREGIVPGVANLRLAAFIGERAARRAIFLDSRIAVESTEGRMLVDRIVPSHEIDVAVGSAVHALTSSGLVSVAANRRALRFGREPVDEFRAYMAHFAVAQADCYFSQELADNLHRNWTSRHAPAARHAET